MLIRDRIHDGLLEIDHSQRDYIFYLASKEEGMDWASMDIFPKENTHGPSLTPEDIAELGYKCIYECRVIKSHYAT